MILKFTCLVLILSGVALSYKVADISPQDIPKAKEASSYAVTAPIDFDKNVLPILKANCSPCHFKGGKLYEKLPFDQPSTIINHSEGILKRIKNEEAATIRQFVEENTKKT